MARRDKFYFGTNTKMTKTIQDTENFLRRLSKLTNDISEKDTELFVIPSYTALDRGKSLLREINSKIKLGAQNMCWEDNGQFTGEISPKMLDEVGIDIVMVGHSERRHIFGENDEIEGKKIKKAAEAGFIPLLCIGETKEQKDYGISDEILAIQLKIGLSGLSEEQVRNTWIAYEPVWAIGVNGIPANADYVQGRHLRIRDVVEDMFKNNGRDVPVFYGGSINNKNAVELVKMPDIDGLFIGRSAWDAENFSAIIHEVLPLSQQRKRG